jgi:hypothetical protein
MLSCTEGEGWERWGEIGIGMKSIDVLSCYGCCWWGKMVLVCHLALWAGKLKERYRYAILLWRAEIEKGIVFAPEVAQKNIERTLTAR